jgi:hypothetical protein
MPVAEMTTNLQDWIEERSGGIRSIQIAWAQAISIAQGSGWTSEAILEIGSRFERPGSLIKLCESAGSSESHIDGTVLSRIRKQVDDSIYSTSEWIRALETLLQFLIREGRSSKLEVQLGYLACSGEYLSTAGSLLSFEQGVSEFLADFGFDG